MPIQVKKRVLLALIAYLLPFFCGCVPKTSKDNSAEELQSITKVPPPQAAQKAEHDEWDLTAVDVSNVHDRRKLIALTFDDSPSSTLEAIVAVFLGYNSTHPMAPATATVFCNGRNVSRHTLPTLFTAYAAGFELGNHTQNHKNLPTLSTEEIQAEIDQTDHILERIDGQKRHLLRAPFGNIDQRVRSLSQAPIINWFIDTVDWTGVSVDDIYQAVWEGKGDGVIVLMHDGYENTVQALKRLLPDLYDAGYQVVSVSQMAKAHGCNLKIGGVYTRARRFH